jgi:hypothetical protein
VDGDIDPALSQLLFQVTAKRAAGSGARRLTESALAVLIASVITSRFLNRTTGQSPSSARDSVTMTCARRLPRAPTTTVSTPEDYRLHPQHETGTYHRKRSAEGFAERQ